MQLSSLFLAQSVGPASWANNQWVRAGGAFLLGAIVSAIATQFARRYFERPRLQPAVARLRFSRTRNRRHLVIPISAALHERILEAHVTRIQPTATFLNEDGIDYCVLELYETQGQLESLQGRLDRLQSLISNGETSAAVVSLSRDSELLEAVKVAVVTLHARAPVVPPSDQWKDLHFPLEQETRTIDGRSMQVTRLNIPGPFLPVLSAGDAVATGRLAALMYATASCNATILSEIIRLSREYLVQAVDNGKRLRMDLEEIKGAKSYLEARVLIASLGKEPALISRVISVAVEGTNVVIPLELREFDESAETQSPDVIMRDEAFRIEQTYGMTEPQARLGKGEIRYIGVSPGSCISLDFVSLRPLTQAEKTALEAAQAGHLDCRIESWMYVPYRFKPFRYLLAERKIKRRQRLQERTAMQQ